MDSAQLSLKTAVICQQGVRGTKRVEPWTFIISTGNMEKKNQSVRFV